MANEQNLRPGEYKLTVEEQKRGGIASGKARREKADLRKNLQMWLESEVTTDKKGNPMTGAELMTAVAVKEMTKGNHKFWELIRDTSGQKPVEKVMVAEVDQSVIDDVEAMVMEAAENDQKD